MKSLTGGAVRGEERLPVLVFGVNSVKLLGLPLSHMRRICKGTKVGPKIASATVSLLNDWKCVDDMGTLVFDSITSNTGDLTAACVSKQKLLQKELLWLPCRHHIGERILVHCWQSLEIESSSRPQTFLFKKYKENFPKPRYSKYTLFVYTKSKTFS